MLYSIRMRAAQGGAHEQGGRHISGAERLVSYDDLTATASAMLSRAFGHSRGHADFININIEAVQHQEIVQVPLLPMRTAPASTVTAGHIAALDALTVAGVSRRAAKKGMDSLLDLPDSMRGAMLVCAATGRRLDSTGQRGIRVSRMDIESDSKFTGWLAKQGLTNIHVREALVLAAKVAYAPGIVAELCWSDDPDYTTGYVASSAEYIRFPHLKPFGSPIGGRIFFIDPNSNIEELLFYLEHRPVIVKIPREEGEHIEVSGELS